MALQIYRFIAREYSSNVYLLYKTKSAILVDAGGCAREIAEAIQKLDVQVEAILLTHAHFDHIAGLADLKKVTNAKVYQHQSEADWPTTPSRNLSMSAKYPPADVLLKGDETLTFGDLTVRVLHTPGHTPGGLCFVVDNCVCTGDTLFQMSIGRTDFPGGDMDQLTKGIREKLYTLPDDMLVLPGHGPETSIRIEKDHNAFVRA